MSERAMGACAGERGTGAKRTCACAEKYGGVRLYQGVGSDARSNGLMTVGDAEDALPS